MNRKKTVSIMKFIFFSLFGCFAFFVQIELGGNTKIPVDHLIALLKTLLKDSYAYVVLFLILGSVYLKMKRKKARKGTDAFFFLQSVTAFGMTLAFILGMLPEPLEDSITSALDATGNILCAIFLTSFFIPFLTEYGLVDFVGVFFQPIMRKIFKTPGSSAVIGVSAFLGNYSMGHVLSRKMYEENRFTEKESVIVATGFSTCSIGLMINLVNYLNLMPYWNYYVVSILLVTFGTTAFVARMFPITRKKEEYRVPEQAQPEEQIEKGQLWKEAVLQGIGRAESAPTFFKALGDILKRVLPIICEITGTSMFIIILAIVLSAYTEIFAWMGYLFFPLLRLTGLGTAEAVQTGTALSACILEPVLSGVICNTEGLSMTAKWITAIVPYSSIIFFAGFIPSLYKSRVNVSLWEMLVIWIERMLIGIVLAAVVAYGLSAVGIW